MPAFLAKLTEHIYAAHTNDLGKISIVLPNRRAILYIKNNLSRIITKTTFLPEFYSIEDFVVKIVVISVPQNLSLTFPEQMPDDLAFGGGKCIESGKIGLLPGPVI